MTTSSYKVDMPSGFIDKLNVAMNRDDPHYNEFMLYDKGAPLIRQRLSEFPKPMIPKYDFDDVLKDSEQVKKTGVDLTTNPSYLQYLQKGIENRVAFANQLSDQNVQLTEPIKR